MNGNADKRRKGRRSKRQCRGRLFQQPGAKNDLTATAHRVSRVEDQIQQHLLDQFPDAPDARQGCERLESQDEFLVELVAQQPFGFGDELIDIAQLLFLAGADESEHGFHDA